MACNITIQKSHLIGAMKQIYPAVDKSGKSNESSIAINILCNGSMIFKAGMDTCRVKTSCRYVADEELTEDVLFTIDYRYLSNAVKTVSDIGDLAIKITIRDDRRIEFWLPENRGSHTIPIQDDELTTIDSIVNNAEEIFTESVGAGEILDTFKMALGIWGLIPNNERDISQMIVIDNKMTVCSPGFYFTGKKSVLPEGLRIAPDVVDKTRRFLEQWSNVNTSFKIIKTEKWEQTWGLIEVVTGEESPDSAKWIFRLSIPDENSDELSATLMRMGEDQEYKGKEGNTIINIRGAIALARQIEAATAVTEDTHVVCEPRTKEKGAVLVISSKNMLSAKSIMGFPIEKHNLAEGVKIPSIEWNVEAVKGILSIFGKGRVTITFDEKSMKTYFNDEAGHEVFMSHLSKEIGQKTSNSRWKKGESTRDRLKKKEQKSVVIGGSDEGFKDLMGDILDDNEY